MTVDRKEGRTFTDESQKLLRMVAQECSGGLPRYANETGIPNVRRPKVAKCYRGPSGHTPRHDMMPQMYEDMYVRTMGFDAS